MNFQLMEYKFPETYETLRKEEQLNKLRIISSALNLTKDSILLDLGCGTGLSNQVFNCKIIGLDLEYNLLKQAKFNKVLGFGEILPFKDKAFDAVISVTSLHNFNNIEQALKEIKRVGKTFAFSVLRKSIKYGYIIELISREFEINEIIEERNDTILICKSL